MSRKRNSIAGVGTLNMEWADGTSDSCPVLEFRCNSSPIGGFVAFVRLSFGGRVNTQARRGDGKDGPAAQKDGFLTALEELVSEENWAHPVHLEYVEHTSLPA